MNDNDASFSVPIIPNTPLKSPDADEDFTSILGMGVTYEVATDTVLDAGCNFGLEGTADDFNFFTGISIRY